MKTPERNKAISISRLLRVARVMRENNCNHGEACAILGYRPDSTSRAKMKFIRDNNPVIVEAFKKNK